MNRRAMFQPLRTIFLGLALTLSACQQAKVEPEPIAGVSLTDSTVGGPFTLTGKDGTRVSSDSFKGKYRIVYFGYTFCPDACPTDMNVLIQGLNRFAKANPALAAEIQPFFITIDPARDTPERVGQFAAAFSPKLIGLSGSQAEIDAVAAKFAVVKSKGRETPGGYLMEHTRNTVLLGRNGEPIEILPVFDGPDAVAADLAKSVR
ncbi:MAG: SCO family protein [Novosphingobium sp.]